MVSVSHEAGMGRKYTLLCNNILREFKKATGYIFKWLQISTVNQVWVFKEMQGNFYLCFLSYFRYGTRENVL